MKIYRALLTIHDFFFYVTREYGSKGITEELIHNYALMYALNENVPVRVISDNKPHYNEDLIKATTYATPAKPYYLSSFIGMTQLKWVWSEPVWISYNALDSTLLFTMEKDRILGRKYVLPKFGTYLKYPPLNTFEFFIIGNKPSKNLIRIGKKLIQARLKLFECEILEKRNGIFNPSHFVNYSDIRDIYKFIKGKIVVMPPSAVIMDATLEGEYLVCECKNEFGKSFQAFLAVPDKQKYPNIFS